MEHAGPQLFTLVLSSSPWSSALLHWFQDQCLSNTVLESTFDAVHVSTCTENERAARKRREQKKWSLHQFTTIKTPAIRTSQPGSEPGRWNHSSRSSGLEPGFSVNAVKSRTSAARWPPLLEGPWSCSGLLCDMKVENRRPPRQSSGYRRPPPSAGS